MKRRLFIAGLEELPKARLLSKRELDLAKGGNNGISALVTVPIAAAEAIEEPLFTTLACGEEPNSGC